MVCGYVVCLFPHYWNIRVEDVSSRSRADMVILHSGQVFILEFKVTRGKNRTKVVQQTIEQIQNKKCADKYRKRKEPIHLVGIAFDSEDGNIADFKATMP